MNQLFSSAMVLHLIQFRQTKKMLRKYGKKQPLFRFRRTDKDLYQEQNAFSVCLSRPPLLFIPTFLFFFSFSLPFFSSLSPPFLLLFYSSPFLFLSFRQSWRIMRFRSLFNHCLLGVLVSGKVSGNTHKTHQSNAAGM